MQEEFEFFEDEHELYLEEKIQREYNNESIGRMADSALSISNELHTFIQYSYISLRKELIGENINDPYRECKDFNISRKKHESINADMLDKWLVCSING